MTLQKLAVTLSSIFTILNKLSGVYGLIAIFVADSETRPHVLQSIMYVYSSIAVIGFIVLHRPFLEWSPKNGTFPSSGLIYAHFYVVDAILNILFTGCFLVMSDILTHESLVSHPTESRMSIVLIMMAWLLKLVSCFVVVSFARRQTRQYDGTVREDGWKGKVDRALLSLAPSFWLNAKS